MVTNAAIQIIRNSINEQTHMLSQWKDAPREGDWISWVAERIMEDSEIKDLNKLIECFDPSPGSLWMQADFISLTILRFIQNTAKNMESGDLKSSHLRSSTDAEGSERAKLAHDKLRYVKCILL